MHSFFVIIQKNKGKRDVLQNIYGEWGLKLTSNTKEALPLEEGKYIYYKHISKHPYG